MFQPGESIDGYRIIRLIGSGGFGEVWLCQSEALGDLRALKFIPRTSGAQIQKEFDALCRYRTAAGQLRSPSIMPIEHVNRTNAGLFYIMPLADGHGAEAPRDPAWCPLTLAAVIEARRRQSSWLTSAEIKDSLTPILQALQLLSDAGLVHRDVKPENILYLNGTPCLADISLLGEDSHNITRCGTPGYSAPSWFLESGGHPDMFGAATTIYTLLTGNPPDKMGRSAFRWPPQGEASLSVAEKQEWLRIYRLVRRMVDERSAERFRTFDDVAEALSGRAQPESPQDVEQNGKISSDPSNPDAFTEKELADYRATASLAGIYYKEKNYQASLEMIRQLNRDYPISNTFPCYSTLRAQCLYQLGRHEESHAELRRGLLGKRLDLASFGERIKLWEAFDDFPGAEAEATLIIEGASPITLHYMARARIRLRLGNLENADKDIESIATLDDDPARPEMAANLRASYAEEFPEYARYLAERVCATKNVTAK